jgi:flagellar hook protein FlgE
VLRSLFSGISGLRQHQTMMDVVGNNIANVNTNGYKSASVVFEDTLSQMMRASGAATPTRGGINPAQVGLGVQLGGISTNFGQGSAQSTGRSTDLMISGDGFFVVRNGNEDVYSRAGSFTFDSTGRLVNNSGMVVQGWAGTNGVVDTDGALQDIRLPAGTLISPVASSKVGIGGNITSGTASTMTLSSTAYDSAGNAHDLTLTLTPDGSGGFGVDVLENGASIAGTAGALTFNANGSLNTGSTTNAQATLADGTVIDIDLAGITAYGGAKTLAVKSADGFAAGSLQQFQISPDGTVVGIFSNGQKLNMAQIALANFNNPGGLEKMGNSTYRSSTNSGIAQVGTPADGGRGTLIGGSLEMSNVDLASEFTNLIIAQRGFQANSRVITTSDQLLEELVNIKR